jgi:hypothetical protein
VNIALAKNVFPLLSYYKRNNDTMEMNQQTKTEKALGAKLTFCNNILHFNFDDCRSATIKALLQKCFSLDGLNITQPIKYYKHVSAKTLSCNAKIKSVFANFFKKTIDNPL